MNIKPTRGGAREGAGAPKKAVKRKALCIKLPPELIAAIPEPRTRFIEMAIIAALENLKENKMNKFEEALNNTPDVYYHDGGLLFAGDDTQYNSGWYIFLPGIGAFPVDVNLLCDCFENR